jgi:hypothetical protein
MPVDDSDPKPGDFDDELRRVDPDAVQVIGPCREPGVSIQVVVHGDDAVRLERIARSCGKKPGDVVAELLRDADRSAV